MGHAVLHLQPALDRLAAGPDQAHCVCPVCEHSSRCRPSLVGVQECRRKNGLPPCPAAPPAIHVPRAVATHQRPWAPPQNPAPPPPPRRPPGPGHGAVRRRSTACASPARASASAANRGLRPSGLRSVALIQNAQLRQGFAQAHHRQTVLCMLGRDQLRQGLHRLARRQAKRTDRMLRIPVRGVSSSKLSDHLLGLSALGTE